MKNSITTEATINTYIDNDKYPRRACRKNIDDKEERFIRHGERKASKVIDDLRAMRVMARTGNYKFTIKQVNEMFDAIQSELDIVRDEFTNRHRLQSFSFKNK